MGMFSEIATESTVREMVKQIKKELAENKDKPEVCAALKKIGRYALTLFEYSVPDWVLEYQQLFKEESPKAVFVLWDREHSKGSLDCKIGCCGDTGGLMVGMAPILCICGGVIHGDWAPQSVVDEYGPHEEFRCDSCDREYAGDEVADKVRAKRVENK